MKNRLEYSIKELKKTKMLPRRFKLELTDKKKKNSYIMEEWEIRHLITILDNKI